MPTGWNDNGRFGRLIHAVGLILIMNAGTEWFSHRFLIGHDQQTVTCLQGSPRWFLIDREHARPEIGDLLAFRADARMAPEIPEGTLIVKRIEAEAGDTIEIGRSSLRIQDHEVGLPFPHRSRLGNRTLSAGSRFRLPDHSYFVLGDHPRSLDSRYYGEIHSEQVIGLARVLF